MTTTEQMTGAELQTLREACGMSREDLAGLADVQARTVKHWEGGRAGVPADVADLVRRLDAMVSLVANEALQGIRQAAEQAGQAPDKLVLLRYQNAADLTRYRADMDDMPAVVHGAIVNRVRLALPWLPGFERVAVRVVWMLPEDYEAWRRDQPGINDTPDNEATRSAWAAGQVQTQAIPHRADQPPA